MTHICASKLTIFGPENGLPPGRRQAIIWTNDGILLIWPLETNLNEKLMEINGNENVVCEMSAIFLGLFVLTIHQLWLRKWLGIDQATSRYQNQWWLS